MSKEGSAGHRFDVNPRKSNTQTSMQEQGGLGACTSSSWLSSENAGEQALALPFGME